ncbi:MAG: hypothetical protein J6Z49_03740 [Kiritimatiellae bacterium]|nr:hypothetical protein [Kiritimatiellia bacterium]
MKYRFRYTVTKALDLCIEANNSAEALRFAENYTSMRFCDNTDDLLTIDHSLKVVPEDDKSPYDMGFYRPDETVRELSAL